MHLFDTPTPSPPSVAPVEAPVYGNNPHVTHAQEVQDQQLPGTPLPEPRVQLVAVVGNAGELFVAKAVNGNRVEQWRVPTAQERQKLQSSGRIVQGGLGSAPGAAQGAPEDTVAGIQKGTLLKVFVGGLSLAAVGAAGYWYMKRRREAQEMDDAAEEV